MEQLDRTAEKTAQKIGTSEKHTGKNKHNGTFQQDFNIS